MKVEFKKSFAKDLKKKSYDRKLLIKVEQIIGQIDEAENPHLIPNLTYRTMHPIFILTGGAIR